MSKINHLLSLDAAITETLSAVNASDLARASFNDLGAIFGAIKKLTDKHSDVHGLANIGQYLADDWGVMNEGNSEALSSCLKELQAIQGAEETKAA